ncbi:hypothetical protein Q3G72_030851 [Acer saccharum]|nr:hypothetical protein Q3G72_030851 [Acer saccharum]
MAQRKKKEDFEMSEEMKNGGRTRYSDLLIGFLTRRLALAQHVAASNDGVQALPLHTPHYATVTMALKESTSKPSPYATVELKKEKS